MLLRSNERRAEFFLEQGFEPIQPAKPGFPVAEIEFTAYLLRLDERDQTAVAEVFAMWSRRAVYETLLNRTFWIRGMKRGGLETGHTLSYRPIQGLTQWCEESQRARLTALRVEFQELLGLTDAPPVILPRQDDDVITLIEHHLRHDSPDLAVFEGYTLSSKREGRDRDARLGDPVSSARCPGSS